MSLFVLIVCVAAFAGLLLSAFRSRELFVLAVDHGKTRVLRGRAPHGLLEGLSDVFARAQVARARVRVLRDGERARISATGLSPDVLQRARNVLGAFPVHKLLGSR
jgi:Protein of unknown function (DUF3634)